MFETIEKLVRQTRSYRRFDETIAIELETLKQLVDLARLAASGANRQPLKYVLSAEPERNELIFSHLAWAAYLSDWAGPEPGQRPTGYVVILGDKTISTDFGVDHGIAAQSMMLGATALGFGGCMVGSVSRKRLHAALALDAHYEILLVLALGKPAETVVVEQLDGNADDEADIHYWRDAEGVHHVPKRSLDSLIVGEGRS